MIRGFLLLIHLYSSTPNPANGTISAMRPKGKFSSLRNAMKILLSPENCINIADNETSIIIVVEYFVLNLQIHQKIIVKKAKTTLNHIAVL